MDEKNEKVIQIMRALNIQKHTIFAQKMDITDADLSRITNGKRLPSKTFENKLFSIFNVNPDWYYKDKGNMFVNKSGVTVDAKEQLIITFDRIGESNLILTKTNYKLSEQIIKLSNILVERS